MKNLILKTLIFVFLITISFSDSIYAQYEGGKANLGAEFAPSGSQFTQDGFLIERGLKRKKQKKLYEKLCLSEKR